jgi:hypothetical protein
VDLSISLLLPVDKLEEGVFRNKVITQNPRRPYLQFMVLCKLGFASGRRG